MRDDDPISPTAILSVLLLIGCLSYVILRFAPSAKTPAPVPELTNTENVRCSEVVAQCVASTEFSFESSSSEGLCDNQRGRTRIESMLGNPLSLGTCPKALSDLEANCPQGCQLAHDRNLVIAGKPQIEVSPKANEAGMCHVRGELPLTIRGTCARFPAR